MSIAGTFTGRSPIVHSVCWRAAPSSRLTSVEVPPMSMVMMRAMPARRAAARAPMTPPAGPESRVRTASRLAVATEIAPPFDCSTRTVARAGAARQLA